MLSDAEIFSSYSVDDISKARAFYEGVLGFSVSGLASNEREGMMSIAINGGHILLYQKDDHIPATYTVLNITVDDMKQTITDLAAKGVNMLRLDGIEQTPDGISHGYRGDNGPDIAWFKDPAGNVLALLQETAR